MCTCLCKLVLWVSSLPLCLCLCLCCTENQCYIHCMYFQELLLALPIHSWWQKHKIWSHKIFNQWKRDGSSFINDHQFRLTKFVCIWWVDVLNERLLLLLLIVDCYCSVRFPFFKTSYSLTVVDKGTELACIHHMKRNYTVHWGCH